MGGLSLALALAFLLGRFGGEPSRRRRAAELEGAHAALQRQQAELMVLFDLMPAMIWFKDTRNRILRVNQRVATASNMRIDELEGRLCSDVYPEDSASYYADDQEVIRSGQPKLGIVESLRNPRGGETLWIQTDKVPYCDPSGKVIGIVVMAQDVTQRRRLESRLVQSQRLETVGKLASGVAHEFNSILTAILGQSEVLLLDLPSNSPLRANATEIRNASERAAALTRQLLAYGRRQRLQPELLDLNAILNGMKAAMLHLAGPTAVVRVEQDPGLRAVRADAGQLEQVILNLVINAAEAMPNGGTITLETSNVTLGAQFAELPPGDYALLAFTDTGVGLSEEVKARLFEPFFTTKRVGEGAGLGLSTCYGIIKQSGGHISVYSEPGRGTAFKVYLPVAEPQPAESVGRSETPELPTGTETILLVEDDPALRDIATIMLRRLGYTVWPAGDGVEAMRIRQQPGVGHVDLLFTDVVLPHMSGRELADRMRAAHPHTRVLYTSTYSQHAVVHHGVLEPGFMLLSKPFTPGALARKVREVMEAPAR